MNWSLVVDPRLREGPKRIIFLLKDVAEKLDSEMVFIFCPDRARAATWKVPYGWMYAERPLPPEITLSQEDEIVRRPLANERFVLDRGLRDAIPLPFAAFGVHSLIATRIGYERREGLLVACNSRSVRGKPPFELRYQLADVDLALVMARVISLDGVGDLLREGRMELKDKADDAWTRDKPELLRTHPGWYVAYQKGTRIALEPSLDRLVAAMNEKLGVPHEPCEFHEIVDIKAERRGPSPRLMPAQ